MAPSTPPSSSSSSQSRRIGLHERSESEKNKLQIRIVPYSPPRLAEGEASGSKPHAAEPEIGEDGARLATNNPAITTPRTAKTTAYRSESQRADSSPSLFSTPATPSVRPKGRGVSGPKLASDSSALESATPPSPVINRPPYGTNSRRINRSQPSHHDGGPASPSWKPSVSRRENYINVHADKTFSVVLRPTRPHNSDRSDSSLKSAPFSNTSTISSHEGSSFDASTEDRHGSPLSSVPERSVSPYTSTGSSSIATVLPEEPVESSPWSHRMVGGLRKVPNPSEFKNKGKSKEVVDAALPPLPESAPTSPQRSPLATKQSFNSEQSDSTIDETTNYRVIGRSSPPLLDSESIEAPPSSSSSNYMLLGQSSPPRLPASSPAPEVADTPASKNYIVYGEPSPFSSPISPARSHRYRSSDESSSRQVRQKYSQESLVVPPLRPHKRSSSENLGRYNSQLSKESLRGRANSFSSLSSIVTQDTSSLIIATANVVHLNYTPSISSVPRSTWVGPSNVAQQRPRMDTHQWSSQLSTVLSEDEASSPGSRVVSIGSGHDRGSSAFGSGNSRQIRSLSSSLAGLEENLERRGSRSRSNSRPDSLDRPMPAYMRGARELPTPATPTIRDHDEHGDGIADLHHRSSRTRLGFSRQPSDRSLRSTLSSRAGSLTSASIPTWARLYYGSGERRWLAPMSARSLSEAGDSRPPSSWIPSRSPSQEQNIYNPRRRPREVDTGDGRPDSMEIAPVVENEVHVGPKKKTSSIWSPHLRLDRRATDPSVWNAPSTTWSAESSMFGRRNIQVVLFVVGFAIPFAWMAAAFLPLPPRGVYPIDERDQSTTGFRLSDEPDPFHQRIAPVDETRYHNARWWRNLNRFMSIVGLLILGVVAALVVVGVRQGWGRR
ncbi:hypothetical protein GGS23DRAFT_608127 [Durotheca rogersii]|uniref:uncharacterized protein n=1 Tax=Durotheca rogersii TaxID=419775 RepID=UPI002220C171|nr:uncharacterized protein GGS23DRAFT_608127 [Durotheca rogersii]KAI5855596.1 hypothetical protein GGS23DRAFT_608127 [Durotheca rogersii]